jgi:hypothetical protein
MDTLTFNSPLLLRHLTFSEAKKAPISEINLKVVLEELDMTMERVSLSGFFISIEAKLGADREHAPRVFLYCSSSSFVSYSGVITSNPPRASAQRPRSS